eukprot:g29528.t1
MSHLSQSRHGLFAVQPAADEIEGSADVIGKRSQRGSSIAMLQRLDQRPMMIGRRKASVLVVDVSRLADHGARLQPQTFNDRNEHGRTSRAVDVEMEALIKLGRDLPDILAMLVEGCLAIKIDLPEDRKIIGCQVGKRQGYHLTLDEDAGAGEIIETLARDQWHPHRTIGKGFQRLLRHEPSKRFAHRHGAGLEAFGKVNDTQHISGIEHAVDQRVTQLRIDPFLQRLAADRRQRRSGILPGSFWLWLSRMGCHPLLPLARSLVKRFEGMTAVSGMSLALRTGEILGLIGPNGAGKTTLFNLIAGSLQPTSGEIWIGGRDVSQDRPESRIAAGVARTFQIPRPFPEMSVLDNVLAGAQRQDGERLFSNFLRPGHVRRQERAAIEKARELLDFVTLSGLESQPSRVLSGGQRKLLELARVLMADPQAILLDEPAAGVNPALLETIIERVITLNRQGKLCMTVPPALHTRALVAGYEPDLPIVRSVDLTVAPGELLVLLGPNGAGKSTFVKAIAGVVPVYGGSIHLRGRDITAVPAHRKVAEGLAFVPQTENIFATLSIHENLQIAAAVLPKTQRAEKIAALYNRFPDLASAPSRLAGALSGGQRQMLAVARALIVDPPVIILDEPSAGLSPKIVSEVFDMLRQINEDGITVILVEQNVKAALKIASRAVVLVEGRIRHEGYASMNPQFLVDGLLAGAMIGLGAIGVTLTYSILRFANFAHGELLSWGAYIAMAISGALGMLVTPLSKPIAPFSFGWSLPLAAVLAIFLTGLLALAVDTLLFGRLRRRGSAVIILVMASFGASLALRSLLEFIFTSKPAYYSKALQIAVRLGGGIRATPDQLLSIGVTLTAVVSVHLLMTRTGIGRSMRAVSENPALAGIAGIDVRRVIRVVWLLGAGLACIAGIMTGLLVQIRPYLGHDLLLPLFAAAILGGIGSVPGAMVAGLIVGISEAAAVQLGGMSLDILAYAAFFLTMALTYAIMCLGLNLQWGQTGLFNVGIAAFVAIGAYVSALLTTPETADRVGGFEWPIVAGWVGGSLAAGIAAWLVGALTIRLRSDYLAIATFGVAVSVQLCVLNIQSLTGGAFGVGFIPRPFAGLAPNPLLFSLANLGLVACVVLALYLALEHLARSPWGRVLRAIREDETAAQALGKRPIRFRLQAFTIGGAIMGLAGAVQAHFIGFIAPDNYLPVLTFQYRPWCRQSSRLAPLRCRSSQSAWGSASSCFCGRAASSAQAGFRFAGVPHPDQRNDVMIQSPERVSLGGGLSISRLVCGLWQVADMEKNGTVIDPETGADALQAYVQAGFDTFDMADHYGSAELITGRLLSRDRDASRRPVAFTKWCPEPGPMSPEVVRNGVEERLRRLHTGRIDLLQFHWWTFEHPGWLDALHEMQRMKEEGLIGALGVTNFDAAHLALALADGIEIATNQVSFSLVDRRAAGPLSDLCAKSDVKLLAYGTLCGGFLSARWLGQPEPTEIPDWSRSKYKRFIDTAGGWQAFQGLLETANRIARKHHVSLSNVASRWVLEHEAVAATIIGARLGESEHRDDNLKVFAFSLDEEDKAALGAAFAATSPIPGDCGDEYRKPPFLTASGDLSHHLDAIPSIYKAEPVPGRPGRLRVSSGSVWEPVAGYSRAVRIGDRILVSGTTATHGADRCVAPGNPGAQATYILDKIAASISALGGSMEDVVRTRIYLQDAAQWEPVSRAHGRAFSSVLPANTLIEAGNLIGDYEVEIEAEALV